MRALNPGVPSALREIIDTALAYEPDQRFATAGEFSRALSDAIPLGDRAEAPGRSAPPARPSGHAEGWDPETLRAVEADLATHIGPVAAVAVKRAAKRTNHLATLYEELAAHILNGRERDEFLKSGGRLTAAMSDREVFPQPENVPDRPTPRESPPEEPPNPAKLDAIEAGLAQYVGPIARLLIKQQLKNFSGMPELYRNLATHIADEADRAAFLNSGRI